jgi:hypothetical protein
MSIILDSINIPEQGAVELKVKRSFEIKVTAEEARRKVRWWLRDEISMLIDADPATLVIGGQVVWRVPAWIGFPHTGRAGIVGSVDVNVSTGAMNNTPECKADIICRAEEVAARQPPYHPRGTIPEVYLAQNGPFAPRLQTLSDGTLAEVTLIPEKEA